MSTAASQDRGRFTRHTVRQHRGISYRERVDGTRSYFVYFQGKYLPSGKTLEEALALQADLRSKKSRGERVILASKITFAEVAEQWWAEASGEFRPNRAKDCRRALYKILIEALQRDPTRRGPLGPRVASARRST